MDRSTDRREQVLQVALRLFAVHGFEATGVRAIADEVGITPSSLYNYGTKEDMLVAIMHEGLDELTSLATAVLEGTEDPESRLTGLVRSHIHVHANSQDAALVADSELRSLSPGNYRTIVKRRREYEEIWATVIEQGRASDVFHVTDGSILRLSLISMCTGVGNWYTPSGRLGLATVTAEMERLALRMAGCDSAALPRATNGKRGSAASSRPKKRR